MLCQTIPHLMPFGRFLVAGLLVPSFAPARDIPVGPGQFLDDAIARAEAGDRILVAPGTYAPRLGRFVVDKSILIEAAGAPLSARLIGSSTSRGPTMTVSKTSAVVLSGLGIQSVWPSEPALDSSGAEVFARNCVLSRARLRGAGDVPRVLHALDPLFGSARLQHSRDRRRSDPEPRSGRRLDRRTSQLRRLRACHRPIRGGRHQGGESRPR